MLRSVMPWVCSANRAASDSRSAAVASRPSSPRASTRAATCRSSISGTGIAIRRIDSLPARNQEGSSRSWLAIQITGLYRGVSSSQSTGAAVRDSFSQTAKNSCSAGIELRQGADQPGRVVDHHGSREPVRRLPDDTLEHPLQPLQAGLAGFSGLSPSSRFAASAPAVIGGQRRQPVHDVGLDHDRVTDAAQAPPQAVLDVAEPPATASIGNQELVAHIAVDQDLRIGDDRCLHLAQPRRRQGGGVGGGTVFPGARSWRVTLR